MEEYHGKPVEYWKKNAEEDYIKTPLSVLKYITVLEEQAKALRQPPVSEQSELLVCGNCLNNHTNKKYEGYCSQSCFDGIK